MLRTQSPIMSRLVGKAVGTIFGLGGGQKNVFAAKPRKFFLITLFSKGYNFVH